MKPTIINELLGANLTTTTLIVCYIFSIIGAVLFWAKNTREGIVNSKKSPHKFSWGYWWRNNVVNKFITLLINAIVTFLWLRFYKDAGLNFTLAGFDILSMGIYPISVLLGYNIDKISSRTLDKFTVK
jgi:hypothetical protein